MWNNWVSQQWHSGRREDGAEAEWLSPGCSAAQVGTGAGEQFFSFRILGHPSYLETNKESWYPQILGRERRGVIPWFHLFSSYPNPPACAGTVAWAVCALGCPLLCSQLSLCTAGTGSAETPCKKFIILEVNKRTAATVCWVPDCHQQENAPGHGVFLLPVSFQTHFTASYSCINLGLRWVPFPAAGWWTPGSANLSSANLCSARGWGFPDGADVVQGHLGLRAEGFCIRPRQGLLSPTLCQDRHECQPWHCPTAPAGLCNGVDATQR